MATNEGGTGKLLLGIVHFHARFKGFPCVYMEQDMPPNRLGIHDTGERELEVTLCQLYLNEARVLHEDAVALLECQLQLFRCEGLFHIGRHPERKAVTHVTVACGDKDQEAVRIAFAYTLGSLYTTDTFKEDIKEEHIEVPWLKRRQQRLSTPKQMEVTGEAMLLEVSQ
ncbi:MAG: hypothetical protein FWF91_06790 [Coriobacteriia bacterium]|nr:hypothetical protein [Coriobacteriia bacterium]